MSARRGRSRLRLVAVALAVALATGCVQPIFHDEMTISTSATAVQDVERLGPVRVERCDHVVLLILPFIADPRDIYDQLVVEAAEKGGNAVVDFELRSSTGFVFIPLFIRQCYEAVGEAARIGES